MDVPNGFPLIVSFFCVKQERTRKKGAVNTTLDVSTVERAHRCYAFVVRVSLDLASLIWKIINASVLPPKFSEAYLEKKKCPTNDKLEPNPKRK